MQVVYPRCCGLDIHKKIIVACSITPGGKEIQSFGTMTEDIICLVDWVKSKACSHVAMESTGVYWKPIFNLLELNEVQTLVVNAQHIKAVPGRKTDVKDAEWIADLLRHGLLKGSYIPDRDQRELRELVRYRRSLIEERTREVNRLQKVLEGANIKLASVASNIMGVSGRAMIDAIIQDVNDPALLASLAKGKLKNKKEALEKALNGLIGSHQKMILATQLAHIDFLDQKIRDLDREVVDRTLPFEKDLELLDTIPGIGRRSAEEIIAEIGTDMNRFPSDAHLSSWAGMSPGQNESAGKRKSSRTRKGNNALRRTLTEAARAAARTKNTYLSTKYHRIAARRGANRAAVAVGHTILVIVYNMLKTQEEYKDLGVDFLDRRKKNYTIRRSLKALQNFGIEVTVNNPEALTIAN